MVSFRGQKKLEPRPDWSPLGVLIQNFQRASPPLSYAESPPPPGGAWHGSSPPKNQQNGIWNRLLDSPDMSAKSRLIKKQYNRFSQHKKTWLDGGCTTL